MSNIQGEITIRHFAEAMGVKSKAEWCGEIAIPDILMAERQCEFEAIKGTGILPATIALRPFEPADLAEKGYRNLVCFIEAWEMGNKEKIGFHFWINISGKMNITRTGKSAEDKKFVEGYSATFVKKE